MTDKDAKHSSTADVENVKNCNKKNTGQGEDEKKKPTYLAKYKKTFQQKVVEEKINKTSLLIRMTSILITSTLPQFMRYIDTPEFMYTITIIIVFHGLLFGISNLLVMKYYAPFAKMVKQNQTRRFFEEIDDTLQFTKAGKDGKNHNFIRRDVDEVEKLISTPYDKQPDDSTLQDELNLLDHIDSFAKKLRTEQFTLKDLKLFYKVNDIVIMDDTPFLDTALNVWDEISSRNSVNIAKFARKEGFGMHRRRKLLDDLRVYFSFSLMQTGLDKSYIIDANHWVGKMIEAEDRENHVVLGPSQIWEARFAAFIAYQLRKDNTWDVIKFLCTSIDGDFNFYDIEIVEKHNRDKKEVLLDSEKVPIQKVIIDTMDLTGSLSYRKGYFGKNQDVEDYAGKLHAFATDEYLVVIKINYTIDVSSEWKTFDDVGARDRNQLLGLVKKKESNKMYCLLDFSNPLIAKKIEEGEDENCAMSHRANDAVVENYARTEAVDKMDCTILVSVEDMNHVLKANDENPYSVMTERSFKS